MALLCKVCQVAFAITRNHSSRSKTRGLGTLPPVVRFPAIKVASCRKSLVRPRITLLVLTSLSRYGRTCSPPRKMLSIVGGSIWTSSRVSWRALKCLICLESVTCKYQQWLESTGAAARLLHKRLLRTRVGMFQTKQLLKAGQTADPEYTRQQSLQHKNHAPANVQVVQVTATITNGKFHW